MPILTAEERLGTVLGGRYALDAILGEGGTSVVYSATQTFTKRPVALKILKPEHAKNRELVSRFLTEARIASTLAHPNVVAILDMGTADGETYLAMERLAGESLAALLAREGPMTGERVLTLLRPLMEAVALAHRRGIIHRDLKPENVLVGDRGDGTTRAILLDFGMAKTAEVAWGHMTQSGILVGTPFYMSPEQTEGASDIDAATDVWAMGVTLYRCLSGDLPFFATAPSALLLAIARGEHVPLGERVPKLDRALAAWVEGALVHDRTQRYADMSVMLEALDRALAGEVRGAAAPAPTPATSASTAVEGAPEEPAARSRVGRYVAVAVALVALVGIAWAVTPSQPPPSVTPPATTVSTTTVPTTTVPTTTVPTTTVPTATVPTTTADVAPSSVVTPPPSSTVPATPPPSDVASTGRDHHRGGHHVVHPGDPTPPPTTTVRSSSGLASEW